MVRFDINLVFSNFGKLKEMQTKLESNLKSSQANTAEFKKQEERLKKVNNQLSEMKSKQDAFKNIASEILPSGIIQQYDKFASVNKSFSNLIAGNKNPMKQLQIVSKDFFMDFGKNATQFAGNIKLLFGKGLSGAMSMAGASIKGLMIGFSGLIPIIASVAVPILAIVAVVYTLKRVWDQNIGGIQTSIFRIGGAFKDFFSKSAVGFDKMLRGLGPVVKILGVMIERTLIPPIKILEGLFLGLMEILTPIAEIIGSVVEPFAELFGLSGGGDDLIKTMNAISKGIQMFGKGVGEVIKVILSPLKWVAEFIAGVVKTFGKFLGIKKEAEEPSKNMKLDRGAGAKTYAQTSNTSSTQVNDNRNFTIMGSGPINQNSTGLIMNMIKKDFAVNAKR